MYISLECIHFARKTDALKLGIIPNDCSNFQKETRHIRETTKMF